MGDDDGTSDMAVTIKIGPATLNPPIKTRDAAAGWVFLALLPPTLVVDATEAESRLALVIIISTVIILFVMIVIAMAV